MGGAWSIGFSAQFLMLGAKLTSIGSKRVPRPVHSRRH